MVSSSLELHRYATGRSSRVVTALTLLKSHLFKCAHAPLCILLGRGEPMPLGASMRDTGLLVMCLVVLHAAEATRFLQTCLEAYTMIIDHTDSA